MTANAHSVRSHGDRERERQTYLGGRGEGGGVIVIYIFFVRKSEFSYIYINGCDDYHRFVFCVNVGII